VTATRVIGLAALGLAFMQAEAPARADSGGEPYRPDMKLPTKLEGIGIDDRHGAVLPRELHFRDPFGKTVSLGDYVDGKPFIVVLAYYDCPMLCSIVLNRLTEGLAGIDFTLGADFHVVTVSIDARDDPAKALAKRKTYVDAYGKTLAGPRAWDFLTQLPGDTESVRKLADTLGFHYRWDDETKQFAHAAGVFVFTPKGVLSRVMYGIEYKPRDLRLALVEASEGKLGSAWDAVLLFCYHYEPRGYTVAVLKLMRFFGGLTVLVLAIWLFRYWRRERLRTEHLPV
jgi:protein SCO1/2